MTSFQPALAGVRTAVFSTVGLYVVDQSAPQVSGCGLGDAWPASPQSPPGTVLSAALVSDGLL